MFVDPPDKVLAQKDPLLANLVGGQPLLHELVNSLVADVQELLRFLKAEEYTLYVLFLRHIDHCIAPINV